ncbi:MAG: divergent PAP2 family protein [Oscillospiraceae bacterium]|nr:divergent PAP2 family protein [Oscillospiraceae bacterium]
MRNAVEFLTGNHILNISILAFVIAQVLKVIIVLIFYKKLDFRRLFGAGGMPSSHSSIVSALAVSVGKMQGYDSVYFAIAAVTAFVVMYDASNVRRCAGEQAKILNYMMEHWDETTPEIFTKKLKELLGHTPFEVFCGAALGIAVGLLM